MNYGNYGYGVGYGTNPYYQQYQQPYQQNQFMNINRQEQQPMQNTPQQDIPFSEVRYGTLDQAKGYIVLPNRAVMFIDQDKSEFYINRADSMGKPQLETYKYYSMSNLPEDSKKSPDGGKSNGISAQLENFLTKKDIEGFITQKDLVEIYTKLDQLQKKIKINDMMGDKK